jgi:glycosyltransferase involved in cell wall biosynthesis
MKILYYMPFKPLGHNNPSGDLIIGTELFDFLENKGAQIELASKFRCRWIYLKPYLWPLLFIETFRVLWVCLTKKPDLWLTYHSYYKAPDVIGPFCCRVLGIPYVIFQGIYSTKRRKKMKTWLGFYLNRMALRSAACVFANKKPDYTNLTRLLSHEKIRYIPPGINPEEFRFNENARQTKRAELGAGERVVVMTAAMFRPGVKTQGIFQVISSCRQLKEKGHDLLLIIAGDGSQKESIQKKAISELVDNAVFLGKLPRQHMKDYYSAADVFAFPGIEESLGMVFLEAQACGLPVVACQDWGAKEAVLGGETGFLSKAADTPLFTNNIEKLITDEGLRKKMGKAASEHVRRHHDLAANYDIVHQQLRETIAKND